MGIAHLALLCLWGLNPLTPALAAPQFRGGPPPVDPPSFSEESLHWFELNQSHLPADYLAQPGFVPYEPLVPYADESNWSLMSLKQFREFRKFRAVRIPNGTFIQKNSYAGGWIWPVGTETTKLIEVKVLDEQQREVWAAVELRLGRKIHDGSDESANWALATFLPDRASRGWRVVMPPHLGAIVEGAITPSGRVRNVNYSLTAPAACMTCHAMASAGPVDLKRGDEFVYGANSELLTGMTRITLRQWNSEPLIRTIATETSRSESDDWIDVVLTDTDRVSRNRMAFDPLLAPELRR